MQHPIDRQNTVDAQPHQNDLLHPFGRVHEGDDPQIKKEIQRHILEGHQSVEVIIGKWYPESH